MIGWKINVLEYVPKLEQIREVQSAVAKDPKPYKAFPYRVRESIYTILLSPILKHGPVDLRKHNKLADRFLDENKNLLYLDKQEYEMLKNAANRATGLTQNDVVLMERIFDAEEVEMSEKKKKERKKK